jgi:hypothetical protein
LLIDLSPGIRNMKNRYLNLGLRAAVVSACSHVAFAQTPAASAPDAPTSPYALSGTNFSGASSSVNAILTAPVPENGAAYKTENGIYYYPSVNVGYGHNDNMRLTRDNTIGSDFINLNPSVMAEIKHKGDRYTAVALVDRTTFSDSSADNRTDSEFEVAGDNYFTARARAGWSASYVNKTDDRGTLNRPESETPDRWHATRLNARLIYGAAEAQGRAEVDLGYVVKTYDNNRIYTVLDDFTTTSVAGRLFYRLGSRSLALVEVRNAEATYDSPLARAGDNTERRYYLGMTWDVTAATTGIVKVGHMTKDFGDASREDYSGSSWEATVRWLPRTYSVFEFVANRSTGESTGVGTYDLNNTVSVNWQHTWSKSLKSEAMLTKLDRSYGNSNRSDSASVYSLAVDYGVLRWLKVGINFARTDYSSSDPAAEYKRNVVMATLKATL